MTKKPTYEELGQRIEELEEEITKGRQAEQSLRLSQRFFEIANDHSETEPLLKELIAEIRKCSGCKAVGIRILDDEGNIPYQGHTGFSESFYTSENFLSIKVHKCMCINVIKGDADPSLPFYTEAGSFFMNGTTRFLATVSEEDKGKTRNICNEAG